MSILKSQNSWLIAVNFFRTYLLFFLLKLNIFIVKTRFIYVRAFYVSELVIFPINFSILHWFGKSLFQSFCWFSLLHLEMEIHLISSLFSIFRMLFFSFLIFFIVFTLFVKSSAPIWINSKLHFFLKTGLT